MNYSSGTVNRVIIIRLEDGDTLPAAIEEVAEREKISRAFCLLVGGIRDGVLVTGPDSADALPVRPMTLPIDGVHEIHGVGMIFPDDAGKPRLHMHASLGRSGSSRTGCIRPGINVWKVGEVILVEISGTDAVRIKDPATGFDLLEPNGSGTKKGEL